MDRFDIVYSEKTGSLRRTTVETVEVTIKLTYSNMPHGAIDGRSQPTKERIMRDLYDMIKEGNCPSYSETRRTQHKEQSNHSER